MSKRTILLTAIGVLAAVAVTMLSLARAQVAPPTNPLCICQTEALTDS